MIRKQTTRWLPPLVSLTAMAVALTSAGSMLAQGCGDSDTSVVSVAISGNYSLEVGKSLSLSAATLNGKDTSYTWSSSATTVATVDTAGTVSGVAAGEAVITAVGANTLVSGTHPVVVVAKSTTTPTPSVVTISGGYSVLVGKTLKLTATTSGTSDTAYTWAADKTTVATVATDGTVTGVSPGTVVITATGKESGAKGMIGLVVSFEIPYSALWLASGHADTTAEAFTHWDSDSPAEVPTSCAKCHTSTGFSDFIGADGSAAEKVDKAVKVGEVILCTACHNDTASALSTVTFPSTVSVSSLGGEARCMTCHQGRGSTDSVDKAITTAAVTSDDEISTKLSFNNIHYFPAGATLLAGMVRGGYQYGQSATGSAKKVYDWRFRHVPDFDTCVECHDPHSLKVQVTKCATCHTGVTATADLKKIRMMSSLASDYDGDGDKTEGIYAEVQGLHTLAFKAIQAYAKEKLKSEICYDSATYPYWFVDTDKDGKCSTTEAASANGYKSWSARLVRAAYNYQMVAKDPGGYAHNAKYLIQVLYDAIEDLNKGLTTAKVDLSKAVRDDHGHFDGAGEPARHWDTDGKVSASCSQCHGGSAGLRAYLLNGSGSVVAEPGNGLDCYTCHDKLSGTYATVTVDSVTFPGGLTLTDKGKTGNLCATCHMGRESKATIDAKIAAKSYSFRNVHYLPAAAVKKGSEAKVGYEYTGLTYAKEWTGHAIGNDCTYCHDPKLSQHTFAVKDNFTKCTGCHASLTKPEEIRYNSVHVATDYDGDGSKTDTLKDEAATIAAGLFKAIQGYAKATLLSELCYSTSAYPYWFIDTDKDGSCSATEAVSANSYKAWDAELMKAAHNYQIWVKEPGAWAHNFNYLVQLLYDSTKAMGGDVTQFTRPL